MISRELQSKLSVTTTFDPDEKKDKTFERERER